MHLHLGSFLEGCTCFVFFDPLANHQFVFSVQEKTTLCFLEISAILLKCVCHFILSVFWVMMCFFNLSDEKSWIFSLVRWVIATHLDKYARQIECVFPQFVGPNTSKEVSLKCQVNINK